MVSFLQNTANTKDIPVYALTNQKYADFKNDQGFSDLFYIRH